MMEDNFVFPDKESAYVATPGVCRWRWVSVSSEILHSDFSYVALYGQKTNIEIELQ